MSIRNTTKIAGLAAVAALASVTPLAAPAHADDAHIVRVRGPEGLVLAAGSFDESTRQFCANLVRGGTEARVTLYHEESNTQLPQLIDITKNDTPTCRTVSAANLYRGYYILNVDWVSVEGTVRSNELRFFNTLP